MSHTKPISELKDEIRECMQACFQTNEHINKIDLNKALNNLSCGIPHISRMQKDTQMYGCSFMDK